MDPLIAVSMDFLVNLWIGEVAYYDGNEVKSFV